MSEPPEFQVTITTRRDAIYTRRDLVLAVHVAEAVNSNRLILLHPPERKD